MKITANFGILIFTVTLATAQANDYTMNNGAVTIGPNQPGVDKVVQTIPGQLVDPLTGQLIAPLPGQIVPALPGQLIAPLPGQIVSGNTTTSLPGQVVGALPGQLIRSITGRVSPYTRQLAAALTKKGS
jgi:hypothetical protein